MMSQHVTLSVGSAYLVEHTTVRVLVIKVLAISAKYHSLISVYAVKDKERRNDLR